MPLDVDISTDYRVFDNLETVQYAARTAESSYAAAAPVAHVQREPEVYEQTAGSAVLPKVTAYWNLWTAELTVAGLGQPRVGDRLTDAGGVSWQVLHVDATSWRTRYRVLGLKQR